MFAYFEFENQRFLLHLMTDIGCISKSNAVEDTKTEDNPVPRANELRSRLLFLRSSELF